MTKRVTLLVAIAVVLAAGLAVAAATNWKRLDVVGRQSIASFDAVLKAAPDRVAAHGTNGGWSLTAPDDSVRFLWSGGGDGKASHYAMMEMRMEPFVGAGLDPEKLPGTGFVVLPGMSPEGLRRNAAMMVGTPLGEVGPPPGDEGIAPLDAYAWIVDNHRGVVNYHADLDHFGVTLGDGNVFEWAKDMKIAGYSGENQDKDIVFVLNPEPLIRAGVDPEKVEGWVYAQVPIETDGKKVLVWKLLKPFDLQ